MLAKGLLLKPLFWYALCAVRHSEFDQLRQLRPADIILMQTQTKLEQTLDTCHFIVKKST